MDDSGLYLLLEGVVRQAITDSHNPDVRCEHPPYFHTYNDCAGAYLYTLARKRLSASEIGPFVVGLEDGRISEPTI